MSTSIVLPNVRKLFIPDPGHVMYEADLKGADAQVVAWEADDDDLKLAFRKGVDIHAHNAEAMWGHEFTTLPEGSHRRDHKRQECKHTVHGIHYGCTPRTTAMQRGWLVVEAERFHRRWLSLHPKIHTNWLDKTRRELEGRNKTIYNIYGFRRQFFGRIDDCFTEALAWKPQSTVALNTYDGALQLEARYWPHQQRPGWQPGPGDVEGMLLQTHDSINFQFPIGKGPPLSEIQSALAVKLPYPDPLTIPWELKMSKISWGDVEKPCKCQAAGKYQVVRSECANFCQKW